MRGRKSADIAAIEQLLVRFSQLVVEQPWIAEIDINPLLVKFHETLSEESVYNRYFQALKLSQCVAHERLTRICFNDYDREIALVAELKPAKKGDERKILGVGRLSKQHTPGEAEFAVLVNDQWHEQGLGTELLKRLIEIGRIEKLTTLSGQVLADNHEMHHICRKVGFKVVHDPESNMFNATYTY